MGDCLTFLGPEPPGGYPHQLGPRHEVVGAVQRAHHAAAPSALHVVQVGGDDREWLDIHPAQRPAHLGPDEWRRGDPYPEPGHSRYGRRREPGDPLAQPDQYRPDGPGGPEAPLR